MAGRKQRDAFEALVDGTAQGIDQGNLFDHVSEKVNPQGLGFFVRRKYFNPIAPYSKAAAVEVNIIAFIMHGNQVCQELITTHFCVDRDLQSHAKVILRRAEAKYTGNTGHNDHIRPGEDRTRCRMAQLVDHFVNGSIFLDVCITGGNIRFRLVVVIITDEIFNRVIREKCFEFIVQLGRQGFIGCQDQGRSGHRRDHMGHCEGFTGSGNTQQHMVQMTGLDIVFERLDGAGLITLRFKLRN